LEGDKVCVCIFFVLSKVQKWEDMIVVR